jgi:hypothetical protein
VFQDFEKDNGSCAGPGCYFWDAWFTSCDFNPPNVQASQGARAGCCRAFAQATAQARGQADVNGGTMGINPMLQYPIDLSSASYIGVYIYDTQGSNTVQLKLRDGNDIVSTPVWSAKKAQQKKWTLVTWPLADFRGVDESRIKNIELYEWNDGFYCFDYVFFQ